MTVTLRLLARQTTETRRSSGRHEPGQALPFRLWMPYPATAPHWAAGNPRQLRQVHCAAEIAAFGNACTAETGTEVRTSVRRNTAFSTVLKTFRRPEGTTLWGSPGKNFGTASRLQQRSSTVLSPAQALLLGLVIFRV